MTGLFRFSRRVEKPVDRFRARVPESRPRSGCFALFCRGQLPYVPHSYRRARFKEYESLRALGAPVALVYCRTSRPYCISTVVVVGRHLAPIRILGQAETTHESFHKLARSDDVWSLCLPSRTSVRRKSSRHHLSGTSALMSYIFSPSIISTNADHSATVRASFPPFPSPPEGQRALPTGFLTHPDLSTDPTEF
jgi:hypothetical protein